MSKLPHLDFEKSSQLWAVNCFEHTLPPYRSYPQDSAQGSEPGVVDLIYCQDARTKEERTVAFYDEVKEVLLWCRERNVVLTICSKSPSKLVVEGMLRAFGVWDWFVYPQVFNSRSKSYHFRNLSEATGLHMRNFLFYDDDIANVNMCSKLGVTCQLVDKDAGFNWRTLCQGLEVFQTKQLSRKSFTMWLNCSSSQPQPNSQSDGSSPESRSPDSKDRDRSAEIIQTLSFGLTALRRSPLTPLAEGDAGGLVEGEEEKSDGRSAAALSVVTISSCSLSSLSAPAPSSSTACTDSSSAGNPTEQHRDAAQESSPDEAPPTHTQVKSVRRISERIVLPFLEC